MRANRQAGAYQRCKTDPTHIAPAVERVAAPWRAGRGWIAIRPFEGNITHRSASASLTPSAAKAPAKARRIHIKTLGREITWSRIVAANSP